MWHMCTYNIRMSMSPPTPQENDRAIYEQAVGLCVLHAVAPSMVALWRRTVTSHYAT
eukprot:COSAG01_NODE_50_length_31487_cov_90.470243_15_plen_57_part_00